MAWTTNITEIVPNTNGRLDIKVSFVNGARTVLQEYSTSSPVDMPWLKSQMLAKIASLEALDTFAGTLSVGSFDPTYTPDGPTQAQIDQSTYATNMALYLQYQTEIALGLRAVNDSTAASLKATLLASPAANKPAATPLAVMAPSLAKLHTITGDSGTKTATFAGNTMLNEYHRGAIIFVRCGTVSGTTPTMSCQLQHTYDDGTTWANLGAAMTNITATNGTAALNVYPAAGTTSMGSSVTGVVTNVSLPRKWRINYTLGGTTPSFALTGTYVQYLV